VLAQFDRRLISQALTNVIKNATEAIEAVPMEERGPAGSTSAFARRDDGRIVIDVIDNGKGLPADQRQEAARALYDDARGGTGLGLAIVGKILEDHGGGIELARRPDVATSSAGPGSGSGSPKADRTH
jgi:two-component system nitrogen regulation sensor histidine kinase NtrY